MQITDVLLQPFPLSRSISDHFHPRTFEHGPSASNARLESKRDASLDVSFVRRGQHVVVR